MLLQLFILLLRMVGSLDLFLVAVRGRVTHYPPNLFIICVKGLFTLFRDMETRGLIHGCRVARGAPSISHLFFIDDSLECMHM